MGVTATQDIFNYWRGLKGPRSSPLRSEIDPAELRHYLPNLFIATANENDRLHLTLAGTRICEIFDQELRGRDFGSLWNERGRERANRIIDAVLQDEQPVLAHVHLSPHGKLYSYDLLLMPLRSQLIYADRVLGALIPHSRQPLMLNPADSLALDAWCFIDTDDLPALVEDEDASTPAQRASFVRRLISGQFLQSSHRF